MAASSSGVAVALGRHSAMKCAGNANAIPTNITHDSKRAIILTCKHDYEYYVKQFDLKTCKQTFCEKIGGDPSQYIKAFHLIQTECG